MAEAVTDDFHIIVNDAGVYQVRASISSPEQMGAFIDKLKETHLKFALATAQAAKPKETVSG